MKCNMETCDGVYEERSVEHRMQVNGELIVVENVPAMVCPVCGSRLFSEETVATLDRIVASVESETSQHK